MRFRCVAAAFILVAVDLLVPTTAAVLGRERRSSARGSSSSAGGLAAAPSAEADGATVLRAVDGQLHGIPTNITANVELLRFTTAYRTGIENVVDLTPYSQLLRAAAAANNLSFYTFIDTWVSNHTEYDVLYLSNTTGQCTLMNSSQGNGWSLSASLVFWQEPSAQAVNTQPREVVNLSPGFYGGDFPIGRVSMFQGNATDGGAAVLVDSSVEFDKQVVAATVYQCPKGAEDIYLASLIGLLVKQTEFYTSTGNVEGLEALQENVFEMLLSRSLASFNVTHIDNTTNTVHGTYNVTQVQLKPKMPVYYESSAMFTPREIGHGVWWNTSLALSPNGEVLSAADGNATLKMYNACMPLPSFRGLPHLLVPVSETTLPRIQALLAEASHMGTTAAKNRSTQPGATQELLDIKSQPGAEGLQALFQPVRVNGSALVSMASIGNVDLSTPAVVVNSKKRLSLLGATPSAVADGQPLCIAARQNQGHLFTRNFDVSRLDPGDRVVFQLAVTGHGWAMTLEQCGEYCHAVYRIHINGRSAANVTQFRHDCKENPVGESQYGTWYESRNGWCPGAIEPGLFVDLTDHVQQGSNVATIELVVWSNSTLQYAPYTDYAGFVFGDEAKLTVGLNAFVYGAAAVDAVRGQPAAFTAAEAALRNGSSHPASLRPPAVVLEPEDMPVLLQQRARGAVVSATAAVARGKARRRPRHRGGLSASVANGPQLPRMTPWGFREEELWPASFLEAKRLRSRVLLEQQDSATSNHSEEVHAADHGSAVVRAHGRIAAAEVGAEAEVHAMGNGDKHHVSSRSASTAQRFNIEERAPWYLYNSSAEGSLGEGGTTTVALFTNVLMQADTRDVQVKLSPSSLPTTWGQVALHFRLSKPPGNLSYDHWDREGSLGLRFQ